MTLSGSGMRLVRFGAANTGIVVEGEGSLHVVDVSASLEGFSKIDRGATSVLRPFFEDAYCDWTKLVAAWDRLQGPLQTLSASALEAVAQQEDHGLRIIPRSSIQLRPPLPSPRARIFAIGANFADHGAGAHTKRKGRVVTEQSFYDEKESGLPPWGFLVIPDLVVGDEALVTPPNNTQMLDYEVEIALVLREVGPSGMKTWGAAVWNDFSLRDRHFGIGVAVDRGPMTWSLQKNFESGNVLGPWLTVSEDLNVDDLRMRLWVNDELRQDGRSSKMLYTFEECVEHIEQYLRLRPGDIITSGTPAGTALDRVGDGYLKPGDVVRAEIEDLGAIENKIGPWVGAPL